MNNKRVKDYLSTLKCSELTKNSYRYDLNVFYNYCESIGKHFDELEIVDVETFFSKCVESGRSKRTILRYRVSLNKFFKYLLENGYVKKNIIERVKIESCIKSEIFCRVNDCKKLYDYFKNTKYYLRDKIIFSLIYEYGINPQEISKLKVEDFKPVKKCLYLKNRVVFLRHNILDDLINYCVNQRKYTLVAETKSLFCSKYRGTFSRVSIYKTINKKAKELNIKVSPRDLRKYAIFKMLKYMNVEDVAKQLGISIERVLAYKGVL